MTAERVVCVFGAGRAVEGDKLFEQAVELGFLLASAGYTVANGGYSGTMRASAKGARRANGPVIGVTCSAFGRSGPNEYITREIQTESLDQRLRTLVQLGDAYLVLPGGTGTLLEFADIWERRNKRFASALKPIIIVGEFWNDLIALMQKADPQSVRHLMVAVDPKDAVALLQAAWNDNN